MIECNRSKDEKTGIGIVIKKATGKTKKG